MKYSVLSIPPFDRQLKLLAKKYPSLKGEVKDLIESLEKDPEQGDPLANRCYKIRMAIASKGKTVELFSVFCFYHVICTACHQLNCSSFGIDCTL